MKKLFKRLALISSAAVGLTMLLSPAVVMAAAAECYTQTINSQGAGPIHRTNCGQMFRRLAHTQFNRPVASALHENQCYLITTGAGSGTQMAIYEEPRDGERCQNWRRVGGNPADNPQPSGNNNGGHQTQAGEGSLEDPTRQTDCNGGNCINQNYLVIMAKWAINLLSAAVGIVITAVIIFAGIEYSSSAGDPQRTAAAKSRIINAIVALVAYMFLFMALQWLIPGGLFG